MLQRILLALLQVWSIVSLSTGLRAGANTHRIWPRGVLNGGLEALVSKYDPVPRFGCIGSIASVPVPQSADSVADITLEWPMPSRMEVLQSLYGRASTGSQGISLPQLFQWTLEHSFLNRRRARALLPPDPVADCLMDLFNISLSLSPVGFERFVGVYERLMRLVRSEYAAGTFPLLDPAGHVEWRNCSLRDWYPPEHAIVYNVSGAMEARRFDLTRPLAGEVTYSDEQLRRTAPDDTALAGAVYMPANPSNPGFDSVTFVRDHGGGAGNSGPLVAVLSEQKLSTSKSRLYINVYRDVVRKAALAQETVRLRWTERGRRSAWNVSNTVLVGHYLRLLNPRLYRAAPGGPEGGQASALTAYLRRFVVPANTVMLDERGLRYLLGPALFELLQIGRNKSRLDKKRGTVNTRAQGSNTNRQMAQYLTRMLQYQHALANR